MDGEMLTRESAVAAARARVAAPVGFLSLRESGIDLSVEPPEPRWSFTRTDSEDGFDVGVIERGVVGMLVGLPGVGKSTLMLGAACAVASGCEWLGWRPRETGRVLFLSAEETPLQVHRRIFRKASTLTHDQRERLLDNLVVSAPRGEDVTLVRGERESFASTEFSLSLRGKINDHRDGYAFVVVDPLSRLAGPDTETSNYAGTAFCRELEALTQCKGSPTVFFAHHVGKGADMGSMFAARGSSSLSGGVKCQLNAKHVEDERGRIWGLAIKTTKSNYTPPPPIVNVCWDGGVLRVASVSERKALDARVEAAAKGRPA